MSTNQGTIVYCIARSRSLGDRPQLEARGLAAAGIRVLPYKELVAIVGDASEERYQVSRSNVKAHLEVIEEVMQHSDVLPLRFGEVAPDDAEVRRTLLEDQYEGLLQRLDRVHDRVELAVRVTFDERRLFDEIFSSHADLAAAGQQALSLDDRIALGQNVAELIADRREREADRLLEELRPVAVDVSVGEPTSDLMLLNAAFLVDRSRVQDFDERVRALGERAAGRLIFKYIGPLPPYSFVDLHVPAQAEAEAQHA